MMELGNITLENDHILLRLLKLSDADSLWQAAKGHDEIWQWMPFKLITQEAMHNLVQKALESTQNGDLYPFVIFGKVADSIVGSTSFLAIDADNKKLEIGATWITPRWQRTAINTASKYLLLQYAFEQLEFNRIEFKTDRLNTKSRNALLRIGATEEGTFRSHMVMPDGRIRDSVYFSIIQSEWPSIKERLKTSL